MITFDEIASKLTSEDRRAIEWRITEIRSKLSEEHYHPDYDDISPHLLQEIGQILYDAIYPESEPEPKEVVPLELKPGEVGFYCRHCEESHKFIEDDYMLVCEKCGRPRVTF